MIEPKNNDHFFVVSGGPGVGKTTLLNELASRTFAVVPEIARQLIIEQKGLDGEALPWKNKEAYKTMMFDRSIQRYEDVDKNASKDRPVFFDRGFLDSICYATLIESEIDERMTDYARKWRYNNKVFILPPWYEIYSKDNERRQDWEEAMLTHRKMVSTYEEYGYEIVEVPKVSVQQRADFVLDQIKFKHDQSHIKRIRT